MKKSKSVMWIFMFLIIIASPSFIYFFLGKYVDSKNYENRNMASKPMLTIENYEKFPTEYEKYYNDNIPFRNQLIRLNNSIDYFLFKQSSNGRVDIGKNGWLFYCNNTDGNPVEQSLGYWHFTNEQLQVIAANLMSVKRILNYLDIEFVLFIAPNKETVYMDELPIYYEMKDDYTCVDQLVDYLKENTDIRIVYPKQELLKVKEENPDILLYRKLDTHWNNVGAYIGAKSLAKELTIEMPSLDEISIKPQLFSDGDLSSMLNISIKNGDILYDIFGITELNTDVENMDSSMAYWHTAGADSRKLFIYGDSYSVALSLNLNMQFENYLLVHGGNFEQQQLWDYDADIFILESVERYVNKLGDFRVSCFSFSVENSEDSTKRVTITPAVSKANLQYVSIFVKNKENDNLEIIQTLKPLSDQIVLDFPVNETGEIYIRIFADELGKEIIEDAVVEY